MKYLEARELTGSHFGEKKHNIMKEQNGYERKRIRKLVIWIEDLYRFRKLPYICYKLTIGNLLEMIKYKITGLRLFHLLTSIL
jgi:hypothetical protein